MTGTAGDTLISGDIGGGLSSAETWRFSQIGKMRPGDRLELGELDIQDLKPLFLEVTSVIILEEMLR